MLLSLLEGRPIRGYHILMLLSYNQVPLYRQVFHQYNYTGMQFFDVKRYKPLSRLMDMAKDMIKESLPIKCLEAVILSLYLTSPLTSLQRFTIRFKSNHEGRCYRHVVLGVHQGGIYGSLGLSRRLSLMYKPFHYKSLTDLIKDFIASYSECKHELQYIKLGSPVIHDTRSCEQIQWKFLVISLKDIDSPASLKRVLDRYCRAIRTL
ncbi:PREDICTED: vasohibin-1-like isoform X2 [Amphimedon queenslandica]|uniref:Vasohibin-1 n=1 Tax=Amphimedon queenslandica TaxID=400682 RepID=A0AAN0IH23_AMPQE|nr:PREDICTED: vasohibin-1-like isoform X2 [Amphimedon queenslandica]|eukprot:XP_003388484.1 PREDICTED: vasohibin-1-like isoform X2 [Amphimedon queenslandica]